MGKLTELRNELMQDPLFKAGYEERGQLVRFGRMVRAARESQGLTQAGLAQRLSINQSEISRLEKGEGVNGPTFDRIVQFAHALGMKLVMGFANEATVSGSTNRPGEGVTVAERKGALVRFANVKGQRRGRIRSVADTAAADEFEPLWSAF
ncbi:helix-turn-helix domain-containing protein [Trinickia dinghuensis]|nr:helix-turn-helix transcriptional regulator [Trinickia dinghuensis]